MDHHSWLTLSSSNPERSKHSNRVELCASYIQLHSIILFLILLLHLRIIVPALIHDDRCFPIKKSQVICNDHFNSPGCHKRLQPLHHSAPIRRGDGENIQLLMINSRRASSTRFGASRWMWWLLPSARRNSPRVDFSLRALDWAIQYC